MLLGYLRPSSERKKRKGIEELMSEADVKQLRREHKERHEYRRKLKEETEKWYDRAFKEQLDELRSPRLRDLDSQ